jgi:hypothetical protein
MKQFKKATLFTVIILSLVFLNLNAGEKIEVNKTFKAKGTVKIKVVSGDCVIKKGKNSEIKVHVAYTFPKDKYKPVFQEEGDTLILKEEFSKNNKKGVSGKSSWTLTVPEPTNIDFKAASGNFSAADLKSTINARAASGSVKISDFVGDLTVEVASGHAEVKDAKGTIYVDTASGKITIKNTKGSFKVKCASGNIEASAVVLTGASTFKTASGNITVGLAKTSEYDLDLRGVSGNVVLDYNGNPIKGYFKFSGQKNNISSPIPFDEDDSSKYSPFAKKYFKKGGSTPKVTLKAVSGSLTLKK